MSVKRSRPRIRPRVRSTTILAVRRNDHVAVAGDGQVTFDKTIMKSGARKVRRLYNDKIIAGFAGSTADAFTLFTRFEAKLEQYHGQLQRAAVEMGKEWRTDKYLRHLEALLIVADDTTSLILSGGGDVIEPDDGIVAIGSGGPYATAAARALLRHTELSAKEIAIEAMKLAAEICIYTNSNLIIEELNKYVVGQHAAKRAVAIALRNRIRRQKLPADMAQDVIPKNIIMIGSTGIGKTEIARRLARLSNSPFLKVEASKFTEVGYVGRDVESMIRDLVEIGIDLVREEKIAEIADKAEQNAEERVLDLLLPRSKQMEEPEGDSSLEQFERTREKLRQQLREGRLNARIVEIEVQERNNPGHFEIYTPQGIEEMDINLRY